MGRNIRSCLISGSLILTLLLVLPSCAGALFHQGEGETARLHLEELKMEMADLKHALHSIETNIELLEEKVQKHDSSMQASLATQGPKHASLSLQILSIEKQMAEVKKSQEQLFLDFKQINLYTTALNQTLSQCRDKIYDFEKKMLAQELKFEDISKLRSTLQILSNQMTQRPSLHLKKHKVRSGDTLEKIAKQYRVSLDKIKSHNQIDKENLIFIGQEIDIPYDE